MRSALPAGPPIETTLFGYLVSFEAVRTTTVNFELEFENGFGQASVVVVGEEGSLQLAGLHVLETQLPMAEQNAFRLRGKSGLHLATLAAMILSLSTCLLGVVCAIRLRGLRWRWA